MIRDRIVVGIRDDYMAERLQIDPELTLDKAISIARQGEMLKKQQPTVRIQQHDAVSVKNIDAKKQPHTKRSSNPVTRPPRQGDVRKVQQCTRCGRSPPHLKAQCPAREALCRKCSKKRHFQAMCHTGRTVGTINKESEDDIQ